MENFRYFDRLRKRKGGKKEESLGRAEKDNCHALCGKVRVAAGPELSNFSCARNHKEDWVDEKGNHHHNWPITKPIQSP